MTSHVRVARPVRGWRPKLARRTLITLAVSGLLGLLAFGLLLPGAKAAGKLSGTPFGTGPSWSPGTEYNKVFDGNTSTFFDNLAASGGYAGLDLGENGAASVSKIRFFPRSGYEWRMAGGKFQGSNTGPDSGFVDLYTVPATPAGGWNEVLVSDTTAYRYLRYLSPTDGYGNVAEVEFYSGTSGYSLPSPWVETAIGNPAVAGTAGYDNNGTYIVRGNGPTIGWTWDKFYYVSRPMLSDGSMIVRLSSFTHTGTSTAKYGLLIRENLTPWTASRNIALLYGSDGSLTFQYRSAEGQDSSYIAGPGGQVVPLFLKLARAGNVFIGSVSATGANGSWTEVGRVTMPVSFNVQVGLAVNSGDDASLDTSSFDKVGFSDSRIQAPWQDLDIGNPARAGAATNVNGLYTLAGNGPTIGWTWDKFHYTAQTFTSDGSLTARLSGFTHTGTSAAKYGLMLRENLTPWVAGRNVALLVTSDGQVVLQSRASEGGDSLTQNGPSGQVGPLWLRLERSGNTFTGWISSSGAKNSWRKVGSTTLDLSATIQAGFAVNSGDDSNIDTASFDNFSLKIQPVEVQVNWQNEQKPITRQSYGLNGFQAFNPQVAGDPTYNANLEYMQPGLLRYHSWEMLGDSSNPNGWLNTAAQGWDAPKIQAALSSLTYTDTERLMNIPAWPSWMDTNNDGYLDADKFDAYASFCADLVRIVNVTYPGHHFTYWEPTNERDDLYYVRFNGQADRLDELIDIHNRAARAMKAVDPTIKIGGLAFARPDLYPQVQRFVQATAPLTNPTTLDFVSYHGYASGSASDPDEYIYNRAFNPTQPTVNSLAKHTGDIRAILDGISPTRRIPLWLDEYNISWSYQNNDGRMHDYKGGVFDALVMVAALNSGADATAAWNEKDGVYGKMDNDYSLRPSAQVFALFNNYLVGQQVESRQNIKNSIVTMAVKDRDSLRRTLVIINRSPLAQKVSFDFAGLNNPNQIWQRYEVGPSGYVTSTIKQADVGGDGLMVPNDSVTVLTIAAADTPVLESLQPGSVTAGGPAFVLTVTGSNFTPRSVIRWRGLDLPTTYVSGTQLTARIPAAFITNPKTVTIRVAAGPIGWRTSNGLDFKVLRP